ncbi:MAG: PhzF family phenazine biosynthesis protein [Candidatus Roizmanbacteria bacterium]|nr:PhzF family phenazine biosynthesis protein [Candidatus Roizmanbacteria bacterium]
MSSMKIAHVFTNESGGYGNPVGIIVDETRVFNNDERQRMASESGFSEVVFINNIKARNISIFSPKRQIPFAGHALVGVAHFLHKEYVLPVTHMVSMNNIIVVKSESELTWVRGDLSILPPWNYEELANSTLVDTISREQALLKKHTMVWSWIDKNEGTIHARTFANDWGIPEDEANGSGSMKLAAHLGKNLIIHHGKGSIIYAKSSTTGFAEVGGRVQVFAVK